MLITNFLFTKMATQKLGISTPHANITGWGNQVLNILFTIFVVAIVFGTLLIAVVITNTTLTASQNSYDVFGTTGSASASATNANTPAEVNVLLSWSGATLVSASNPATLTIVGNVITGFTKNVLPSNSNQQTTLTFSVSSLSNNQVLVGGTNFFNIQSATVTGLQPGDTGAIATLWLAYPTYASNAAITPVGVNILASSWTTSVTQPTVGSSSSTPVGVFLTLVTYLITLSSFTGIIILLAIVVVVVGLLVYFFGNRGNTITTPGGL